MYFARSTLLVFAVLDSAGPGKHQQLRQIVEEPLLLTAEQARAVEESRGKVQRINLGRERERAPCKTIFVRLSFWKPAPCGEGGQTKRPEAKHGQSLRGFARLGSITCDACLTRAPEACGAECLGDHHCSSARIPARRARIQDLVNPAARPAAWWLLGSSHGMEVRQVNNPFPGESI